MRDGAVARATHDYLYTNARERSAPNSTSSAWTVTRTLVISRNARCPSLLRHDEEFAWLDTPSEAVGIHRNTKPAITELPLTALLTLVVFTDGVWSAGALTGSVINLPGVVLSSDPSGNCPAQVIADAILDTALSLDKGRPRDDATVLVVKIMPQVGDIDIRRLSARFPI